MQPFLAEEPPVCSTSTALRFILTFAAFLLAGVAIVATVFVGLHYRRALPPPPLTGTSCIDEKLAFLRSTDLTGVDLLAVGSSTTWRNLDLRSMKRSGLAAKPINAAPCYLYVNQTAYWADLLLASMPAVKTLLTVMSPRDFELCAQHETAFVDRAAVERYVFGRANGWLYYVTNLRLDDFVLDALRFRGWRTDPATRSPMAMDAYGSSPVNTTTGWQPGLTIDERCFAALDELRAVAARRAVELVVVTLPIMPAWRQAHDPQGRVLRDWKSKVEAISWRSRTTLVDGTAFEVRDEGFADPVHLMGSEITAFSDFISSRLLAMRERRAAER